jgi:hypothetical protein
MGGIPGSWRAAFADPAVTSRGTCALICPGLTYRRGAGMPLMERSTPPAFARLEPKMVISEPGATAAG